MKIKAPIFVSAVLLAGITWAGPGNAYAQAANRSEVAPAAHVVVTANAKGSKKAPMVTQDDVEVQINGKPAQIGGWLPLQGENAGMQLVILIDDSARSYFSLQIPSLKKFILALPPSTQVAVAYMDNGIAEMAQTMTPDHALAAKSLRLTNEIPAISGSPYFVLSSLAKHWPSVAPTNRRVVFMVTNGEDPYYTSSDLQDPYVAAAIADSQKAGLLVYSIYFRDKDTGGSNSISTLFGQSYLLEVANQTGGELYTEAMISPVSFDPFLKQFRQSLDSQYLLGVEASGSGLHRLKVQSKLHGVKFAAPSQIVVGSPR